MPYTSKVPEHIIDLRLPESLRWYDVIRRESRLLPKLSAWIDDELSVIEEYLNIPSFFNLAKSPVLQGIFGLAYKAQGGLYVDEIRSWSSAMGISAALGTAVNCLYELSHMSEYLARPFGCTAGIVMTDRGPVHARSMDWPVDSIGRLTRLMRFYDGDRHFVSVGILGFVGVLSGMVPGAYSATINWAPPHARPTFDFGPAFLLRTVLETCDTYDEAVEMLSDTTLSTSVFFTVCGARRSEACVIERTPTEYSIRKIGAGPLVQANHHVSPVFQDLNNVLKDEEDEDGNVYNDSKYRADMLRMALKRVETLDDAERTLDVDGVCNDQSFQQMVFRPADGEVRVRRWV